MKNLAIALLLLSTCAAHAQEVGQVISRAAVYQQVIVPRQTCTQTPVTVSNPSSGAGALMGAIAGGAIGNQIGGGSGRALATIAGVMGGAMMGDKVENSGAPAQNQTTCTSQNVYENRLTGYNVVYEYAGKQFNVVLPQDPGPTLQLQVTPVMTPRSELPSIEGSTLTATASAPLMPSTTPTVIHESRVVYVPTPVYRSYAPVYTHVDLAWGWRHGHGHGYSRRDGRWR
jgi:uncharacterized protein YcfJ